MFFTHFAPPPVDLIQSPRRAKVLSDFWAEAIDRTGVLDEALAGTGIAKTVFRPWPWTPRLFYREASNDE
jgi:hypothetical protein